MSLLSDLYEILKEKQTKDLQIKYKEDGLQLLLFPTDFYKIEEAFAFEEDNSFTYMTMIGYNALDTFLIENSKDEQYKKYFELEPLKSFREEVEAKIKNKESNLETNEYFQSLYLTKMNLKEDEIRNALYFFSEIFSDKLKNPNDFQWHNYSQSNQINI